VPPVRAPTMMAAFWPLGCGDRMSRIMAIVRRSPTAYVGAGRG
jgi:hypothetical protein